MRFPRFIAVGLMTLIISVLLPSHLASATGKEYECGKAGLKCTAEVVGGIVKLIVVDLDTGAVFHAVFKLKENTEGTLFRLLEVSIPNLLTLIATKVDEKLQHVADVTLQILGATVAEILFGLKANIETLKLPVNLCVSGTNKHGQSTQQCVTLTVGPLGSSLL